MYTAVLPCFGALLIATATAAPSWHADNDRHIHQPAAAEDQLVTPFSNETLYHQQANAFWSATAYKDPRCIFTPDTIEKLRTAVLSVGFTDCRFAVRSGGHSPFSGFASIDNGLLISMSKFTDLHYDEATHTQRSGMGNRWGDIYGYLAGFGRIVVGGRLNDVGLALATGGGLSHLSNAHGWVAQNVVSYEVMLANGSHVNASATENPDLYFGVKVANNNFGIITHINQRTFPMGKVWGGSIIYSANYSEDFMAAIAEYQEKGQLDTKSAILPYLAFTNDTILSTFVYLDHLDRPTAFAPFYDIPSVADTTQIHDSFYEFASGGQFSLPRWTYGTTTLYLDRETYVGLVNVISKFVPRVQGVQSGTLALMAQPISKSMAEASRERGGDPMNVTPRDQLWAAVNIGWSLESDDDTVYQILQDCVAAVDEYVKVQGVFDGFRFINDAYTNQQPFRSYGEDSWSRLKDVHQQYDPMGVFQHLVPGGFKLH
ncbi:hypothetical protein DL768_002920 [Monosporascus sp. mg162]|nr:hypothetical protein DL768_002920 [Monosporascus sp. mg162]